MFYQPDQPINARFVTIGIQQTMYQLHRKNQSSKSPLSTTNTRPSIRLEKGYMVHQPDQPSSTRVVSIGIWQAIYQLHRKYQSTQSTISTTNTQPHIRLEKGSIWFINQINQVTHMLFQQVYSRQCINYINHQYMTTHKT